jgi:hypothetical protein
MSRARDSKISIETRSRRARKTDGASPMAARDRELLGADARRIVDRDGG